MKYWIYIWFNSADHVAVEISDTLAAYEFYRKAAELVELVDGNVDLVDFGTGEVIESTNW